MAKKKKPIRRTHRRRRVGAIDTKIDFTQIGLVIAGAVGARILTTKLAASTNATMQKAAPYSGVILGIVLPMFIKNAMVKNLSLGLAAGGGASALGPTGLKVISGFENSIGYPYYAQLPNKAVAGIGNTAGDAGLTKGTRSNFSGSRNSQINTIAGIGCTENAGGGAGGSMN